MKNVVLFILTMNLVSCGVSTKPEEKDELTYFETSLSLTPIVYELDQDEIDCQEENPTSELSSTSIFRNARIEENEFNLIRLKKWTQKNSLSHQMSLMGSYFESFKFLASDFDYEYKVLKPGYKFKICRGAMINTAQEQAYSLLNTFKEIEQELKNQKLRLPPVKINILPMIKSQTDIQISESDVERKKGYLTDNAYYYGSREEIVFLPQSQEALENKVFGGFPLWKIPMVAGHEYGHHVFKFFVKKNLKPDLCFDNFDSSKNTSRVSFATRKVDKETALSAMNEGFADLFSFYTLGDKANIDGLPCFSIDRGIHYSQFSSGTPKVFDEKLLSEFNSLFKINQRMHCEIYTNFQDVHMVGAVWAHFAHTVLNKIFDHNAAKLAFILKWVKEVRFHKAKDSKQIFVQGFKSFIDQSLKYSTKDELCPLANKLAPAIFKNQKCSVK